MKQIIRLLCIIPHLSYSFSMDRTEVYPVEVEKVLEKSEGNRKQLEEFLEYARAKDSVRWKAACFLVGNMDIHYSEVYHWKDEHEKVITFDERSYPTYSHAIKAFNELNEKQKLHAVVRKVYDMHVIKAAYLISNLELAMQAWKKPCARHLNFDEFCEYLLPYRNLTEQLEDWREAYNKEFVPSGPDILPFVQTVDRLNTFLSEQFITTAAYESKMSPVSYLSPLQLLFRRRGYCEDCVNFTQFVFRSQGIPCRTEMVTHHATSTGKHFWNATLDERHQPHAFEASKEKEARKFRLYREPAKVIAVTYAKQHNTPASFLTKDKIPPGYLRNTNYIDITDQYWPVTDIHIETDAPTDETIVYAAVLNGLKWHAAHWSEISNNTRAVFTKMARGAVFQPMFYIGGKFVQAAYPVALALDGSRQVLKPDLNKWRNIAIEEQDNYLKFRTGKKYGLFYWDKRWIPVAEKINEGEKTMRFDGVPSGALYLLVPEYSQNKERPFTIDDAGKRHWW